jgi:N-methylhydantoinase A
MPRYRLGIDIGGTFTDATLLDEDTGAIRIGKVSTTPADPSRGFMEAAARLLHKAGVKPNEVRYVVHATTMATNAIIEGKIARTGFVTTEGFRDMLEIARQVRPSLYDLQFEKPRPLVPRQLCFGVLERLDAKGNVLVPLDEDAVRRVAGRLRDAEVEAIAVCLLHSYVNPVHEKRIGAILRECCPQAVVSLSSEVAPEFREYRRATTTIINAGIQPVMAHYLHNIETRLQEAGFPADFLVMQSSGGVFSAKAAAAKPVFMVESGPAAGVMAAAYLGNTLGLRDVVSFDMGGTTAKAALMQNGTPRVTKDYEVGAVARSGGGGAASGYPMRTPVVDLVEIGAGGGSIAWVDSGGKLRVGPHSAGADPGPACYGKGGREPTVTDANLVLGRLNPHYFLGGEIVLDVDRARAAIDAIHPPGLDIAQTAHAIVEIANAAMVNALRLVSVQRGFDPRDFTLIAFGGAGPLHANRLAAETEMATTLIPAGPGVTSALGLLVTDLKHDYAQTLMQRADRIDLPAIGAICERLTAEGRAALAREGVAPTDMTLRRQVDLRYVGQSFELTVPLPASPGVRIQESGVRNQQLTPDSWFLTPGDVAGVLEAFHREHERAYGYAAPEEPVEWVNLRLTAIGNIVKPRLRELGNSSAPVAAAQKHSRPVYFAETSGSSACAIYDRYRLRAGGVIQGPAIIEEFDSTTVIHPGYQALVDSFGNLLIKQIRG